MTALSWNHRLAGSLCQALLGKADKRPLQVEHVKTMLILRNDRLGDMIVSTPLLRALKEAYPHIAIDVLASSVNRDVLDANPHVRDVMVWDKSGFWDGLRHLLAIRRRHYDVILHPQYVFTLPVALKVKLLRAKYLIGFHIEKYGTSTARLGMFDRVVACPRDRHILDNYFSALGEFALNGSDQRYELFGVDRQAGPVLAWCARLRLQYRQLCCLNYQGSGASRVMVDDDIVALCRGIADAYPHQAVIVTFPPGRESHAAAMVALVARANVVLSLRTDNVLQLAALVRDCDMTISPDSAMIHLASAYNRKILGFYINTDNYRWFYPTSAHYRVILSPTAQLGRIPIAASLAAVAQLMAL